MIDNMGRWYPDYMGQQPWQDKQFMDWIARQNQQAQTSTHQQGMKPVTIRAEIIQFSDPAEVLNYQMQPGASQMFMSKDEALIIVREQGQNGYSVKRYPLEPPEPPKPAIDPAQIVTWDALEQRLAQLTPAAAPRRAQSKGDER